LYTVQKSNSHYAPQPYTNQSVFKSTFRIPTLLSTKIPGLLQDYQNVFPGLCRSPAMLNYRQTAVTLYIQCHGTIHSKTFITSCKETVRLHIAGKLHTFIYAWCSIHKRHVG